MKGNVIILAALLGAAAAYTWYDTTRTSLPEIVTADEKEVFKTAPDFQFVDLQGKQQSLANFEGWAVVLNFWASWCAPCVVEFPQMLELAAKNKDVVFLFLSIDEEKQPIERFLKKTKNVSKLSNVFIGIDPGQKISRDLYQTYKIPETYLITRQGLISEKVIGLEEPWDGPDIQNKLNKL